MEITAYHEAGHTLVAYFTQDHAPVRKVSIVLVAKLLYTNSCAT